jgi:beta-lactamase class A
MFQSATRRTVLASAASLIASPALASAAADRLAAIEVRIGGRFGVSALDLASGARIAHRADERFCMCSSFKAMAAAAVLKRVDQGAERLDRFVRYTGDDLLAYAPTTRAHVKEGGLTLGALCEAAVELSDNTAANLILAALGGPAGWTRFVRSLGDRISRLDRTEPALNTSMPGDPRDTTTAAAMLADLQKTALGDALSAASRQQFQAWLQGGKTGDARLRAGLPPSWLVGDKTGTSGDVHGLATCNDIAVAWTPTRPIVIACYTRAPSSVPAAARDAAIADVARTVVAAFRPDAAHG